MTEHELIDYGVSVGWLTPEKAEELKKLLKEKQAIKPTCKEIIHKGKKCKRWSCGRCGRSVKIGEGKYSANFCQHCGFPVKWKDD